MTEGDGPAHEARVRRQRHASTAMRLYRDADAGSPKAVEDAELGLRHGNEWAGSPPDQAAVLDLFTRLLRRDGDSAGVEDELQRYIDGEG